MKSKTPRRLKIEEKETEDPQKLLVSEIFYDAGGPNYFSGTYQERGYYLGVAIHRLSPDGTRSQVMGEGYLSLVETTERFSLKKLQELSKTVLGGPIHKKLSEQTLQKTKNRLKNEDHQS